MPTLNAPDPPVRVPLPLPDGASKSCRNELLDRDADLGPGASAASPTRVRVPPQRPPAHRGISNARPLHPLPDPSTDPATVTQPNIRRRDRVGGVLHEYEHAA